jgi:hypothetical protein
VDNESDAYDSAAGPSRSRQRRSRAVWLLVSLLALESAALVAISAYLIVEIFVDGPASIASAVVLTGLVSIAAVWVGFIVVGVLRGQAWTRAAIVVVQVLIGAVAIGSLQGASPRPDLAAVMLAPAILILVLLFSKSVIAATGSRGDENRTF